MMMRKMKVSGFGAMGMGLVILLGAGCQDENGGDRGDAGAPSREVAPPGEEKPMDNEEEQQAAPVTDESYVGLSKEAAGALAEKEKRRWRVVSIDGEPLPVTMDHDPERLNFSLQSGKVVRVTRG